MGHAALSVGVKGAFTLIAIVAMGSVHAAQCVTQSDPRTTALVELYTSEDCSACLPADRWLSSLIKRDGLLPFALHVDYGDYTGTKQGVYRRQRKLTIRQRMALVYTPQVMLQGRDFRGWATGEFEPAAAEINARTSQVRMRLEIVSLGLASMTVRAVAELAGAAAIEGAFPSPAPSASPALYLAAFETQAQRRLILQWQGPLGPAVERELALLPGAVPGRSGVAAFARDRRSGDVLQALALPACPDTFGYIRPK